MTTTTVIDYVLGRLHDIGVTDIFGVPGDFAFPVQDAIVAHPDINWIGSCNELNALRNSSNSPLPRVWWTSARSAWVARLGMPVRWKTPTPPTATPASAVSATCGELDAALATAQEGGQAAYIEVITDPYEAPALPNKLPR